MVRKRRAYNSAFKPKVALEAIKGDRMISEIAQKHELHVTQINLWKKQLLEAAEDVFSDGNRKRAQRLMRKMGIEGLSPKPRTTLRNTGHRVYPYLLRDLKIERPNQVWCSDIAYIPMRHGFMYLVAVLDWSCRRASWRGAETAK